MKVKNISFGDYIRSLRHSSKLGLRELARKLEMSAAYLNDIESKRSAPKPSVVSKIAKLLKADEEIILDLASKSRKEVAADIEKMIQTSSETVKLLRAIRDFSPEKQIRKMRDYLMTINFKVIIIAAGLK